MRYLHRSRYQNLENTWRNHQEIWNQPRTPNAKCRSRLCSKRLFLGPKSFFPSYYPHHRNSNFLATNKPSGNDFYPNNWRVIIFLFWSLLLVFILLSFFSYLLFWILGFISMGLGSDHDTNSGSQAFSKFRQWLRRLPRWRLWQVGGSIGLDCLKKGVLILVLT